MTLNATTLIATLGMVGIRESIPETAFVIGGSSALVVQGLRESCPVLSVWVDREYFGRLCEEHKVTNHPMTDTLVTLKLSRCIGQPPVQVEVRERNLYYGVVRLENFVPEVTVFDDLTLMIQKRTEHTKLKESSASPEEVQLAIQDIQVLNARQAEKNKVKEVA